jgi:hypothetical protein
MAGPKYEIRRRKGGGDAFGGEELLPSIQSEIVVSHDGGH